MLRRDTNVLHLSDLSVRNFRGIEQLRIARLGRATLLGGRNGVGKTTVLDAIRVHAARGHPNVLRSVLNRREELATALDDDLHATASPDYAALFSGRVPTPGEPILIGSGSGEDDLRIEVSNPDDRLSDRQVVFDRLSRANGVQRLRIVFHGEEKWVPAPPLRRSWPFSRISRRRVGESQRRGSERWDWPFVECASLGPGLPSNRRLARYWDCVALTGKEDLPLAALRLAGHGIERVAVVGDGLARHRSGGRRVVVKLRDRPDPVPLASLGDGITRLFAAGLALAAGSGGFLVVDQVENGMHYSVQREFWGLILRAAKQLDVQVLATTHSNDCVAGFARAAADLDQAESAYVRLERKGHQVEAVEYAKEDLYAVAELGIEAR